MKTFPANVNVEYLYQANNKNEEVIVRVNQLLIIFSSATTQLLKGQDFEFDVSFQKVKFMPYCATQGIINNESIPLFISITNRESNEL